MRDQQPPEASGFFASLFETLGRAFDDVRHKVVEEGWFGRQVTGDAPKEPDRLGWEVPRASFDAQWGPTANDNGKGAPAPERDGPEIER